MNVVNSESHSQLENLEAFLLEVYKIVQSTDQRKTVFNKTKQSHREKFR